MLLFSTVTVGIDSHHYIYDGGLGPVSYHSVCSNQSCKLDYVDHIHINNELTQISRSTTSRCTWQGSTTRKAFSRLNTRLECSRRQRGQPFNIFTECSLYSSSDIKVRVDTSAVFLDFGMGVRQSPSLVEWCSLTSLRKSAVLTPGKTNEFSLTVRRSY